jgi:hypothetical protein
MSQDALGDSGVEISSQQDWANKAFETFSKG